MQFADDRQSLHEMLALADRPALKPIEKRGVGGIGASFQDFGDGVHT